VKFEASDINIPTVGYETTTLMGVPLPPPFTLMQMNAAAMRVARAAQSAEQQQAAKERDASTKRVARAAQPVEQQQAVRERDASVRHAARATQPAEQ
jgi:hypothetical protein